MNKGKDLYRRKDMNREPYILKENEMKKERSYNKYMIVFNDLF